MMSGDSRSSPMSARCHPASGRRVARLSLPGTRRPGCPRWRRRRRAGNKGRKRSRRDGSIDPFLAPVGVARGAGHSEPHFDDGFSGCQLGASQAPSRTMGTSVTSSARTQKAKSLSECAVQPAMATVLAHELAVSPDRSNERSITAAVIVEAMGCRHHNMRVDERAGADPHRSHHHDGRRPLAGCGQIAPTIGNLVSDRGTWLGGSRSRAKTRRKQPPRGDTQIDRSASAHHPVWGRRGTRGTV